MPNYSSCACHVFASKSTLDSKQNDIIEGYLQVLCEDLLYFEAFAATRINDEYLRLTFEIFEREVSSIRPPVSRVSGVPAGEACVFLLTSSSESYCWNDCAGKIQVLKDEGDDRASDLPHLSQAELASTVRGFAKMLAAPWQTGETSISYEIDCTALLEKVEQLPPKEATRERGASAPRRVRRPRPSLARGTWSAWRVSKISIEAQRKESVWKTSRSHSTTTCAR
jgi:hypothetical protein